MEATADGCGSKSDASLACHGRPPALLSACHRGNEQQLLRRLPEHIKPDSTAPVYVATAEDTVLAKLVWFQKGAGVSERQWSDVLGVLRIQKGQLDIEYLNQWAAILGISDLLEKAINETT